MDPALQKTVQQNLENSSFLNEMRAGFRFKIFQSLISSDKSLLPFTSKPKDLDSDVGKIACALVSDFLKQFNLELSKKMMETEGYIEDQKESIEDLENVLNQKSGKRDPLIFNIIKQMVGEGDEEEIQEDIHTGSDDSSDKGQDHLVESAGTSQGCDQSVNSLAMEDFDYTEVVRKRGP